MTKFVLENHWYSKQPKETKKQTIKEVRKKFDAFRIL